MYLNIRVEREGLNREVLERDLDVWCGDNYVPVSTSADSTAFEKPLMEHSSAEQVLIFL
jgi:hypothetical protein